MPGVIRRVGRAVEGTGLENRRAQAPWVRIPHSPPDKKEGRKALFCAGFQETPASAGVMPQGAAVCGDRGGQINRGPRKSAAFVGNQTGVRKHRGFESHTLRQIEKEGRKALFYALQRKVPRLRARRTASTFHRRKVDRKAAGGPLYQGRNAPRNPPLDRGRFCGNAGRHRSAGRARSDGRNHVPPVNPLLFGRGTKGRATSYRPLAPSDEGAVAAGD